MAGRVTPCKLNLQRCMGRQFCLYGTGRLSGNVSVAARRVDRASSAEQVPKSDLGRVLPWPSYCDTPVASRLSARSQPRSVILTYSTAMAENIQAATPTRLASGIVGVDDILGGGLTPHRMYLVEGAPGAGKTTLALQFLLKGAELGEAGLYVTLSETKAELVAVAASHGWLADRFTIIELLSDEGLDPRYEQSVLHPAEVELGETVRDVIEKVEELKPARLVFDSLSELRLLSQNPLRYRRQILALKRYFATRACTVLLLDDNTSEPGDLQLHSIAHGVISLDNSPRTSEENAVVCESRRCAASSFARDTTNDTRNRWHQGYPRLVAAEHHNDYSGTSRLVQERRASTNCSAEGSCPAQMR